MPVAESAKTPGSYPAATHAPPASCAQDGTTTMPRSGEPHGGETSPARHTMFVSSVLNEVLSLRNVTEAGRPVSPTVTVDGNVTAVPAIVAALAPAGASARTPSATTTAAPARSNLVRAVAAVTAVTPASEVARTAVSLRRAQIGRAHV